mmetsp:Transcript_15459/g.16040  ORF Transcript_15459/g.16040 Transcript_15459/m.16040 type:complete len:82 (-) Transcript_15459:79-324(-)
MNSGIKTINRCSMVFENELYLYLCVGIMFCLGYFAMGLVNKRLESKPTQTHSQEVDIEQQSTEESLNEYTPSKEDQEFFMS